VTCKHSSAHCVCVIDFRLTKGAICPGLVCRVLEDFKVLPDLGPCVLLILPCLQDIDGFWFSGIIDQARLRLARLPRTQTRARASSGGNTSVRLGWRCIIFVILLNTIEILAATLTK
jgi:hypothetical protein